MKAKPRMDVLDLDSLKELQRSRGWQRIVERIEQMRQLQISQICQQMDELTTARLRGEIAMCDVMLKVPSILVSEGTSTRANRAE